jgi:PucR family transcriptional regulator, purine catabolism regulatory protein
MPTSIGEAGAWPQWTPSPKFALPFVRWYEAVVMSISVRQLTEIPDLRTRAHAGHDGLDREVTWAHVCELAAPWEWLSGGELVLTTGLGIPEASAAQVEYIEQLTAAGSAGVAIGDHMHAPPLSNEMSQTADRLAFPLLYTAYEVPFIALERVVASANERGDQARVTATLRVYDTVRRIAARNDDSATLVRELAAAASSRLFLVDARSGNSILPSLEEPAPELRDAVLETVTEREGHLPAVLRPPEPFRDTVILPVPTLRPVLLVAVSSREQRPDVTVLQHVATVAALEIEKMIAERERDLRLGASLLAHLIDRRITPEAAEEQLAEWRLTPPLVVAATPVAGDGAIGLHHRLENHGVPHLLHQRGDIMVTLLSDKRENAETLVTVVGEGTHIGLSEPVEVPARVADAVREARWALDIARSEGVPLAIHGSDTTSSFMPHTADAAARASRLVLGPLIEYDSAHGSELLRSLETFLVENRSWRRASEALHVHKQTLVYRMRRVEELTGRHLNATADVAELWLALRAHRAVA